MKLWTYTKNNDERNARKRVQYLRPHWLSAQGHLWLADHYPKGLVPQVLLRLMKHCSMRPPKRRRDRHRKGWKI